MVIPDVVKTSKKRGNAPPRTPPNVVPLPDEDLLMKTGSVAPDALAEDKTSTEVLRGETPSGSPRETLPPGEEQPER